jgi:hypothetical protein
MPDRSQHPAIGAEGPPCRGTPIDNHYNSRPPIRFPVRTNIFARSAISRWGVDPAMLSMTSIRSATRRSGARHRISRDKASPCLHWRRVAIPDVLPEHHGVVRGPLVTSSEL